MTHRLRAVLVLFCTFLVAPALAAGPEVFVEPFALYNTPELDNLAPGLRAMLASRIEGESYAVRTLGDPPTRAGDWVVRTTITRIGKVLSLDAALEPVAGTAASSRSYQTVEGIDQLMPALEQVADRLRSDLTTRILLQPPPPATQPPAAAAVPSVVPTRTPRMPHPAGPTAGSATLFENPRIGPDVEGRALGLVVADADGDANQEIVVLFEETIVAFRDVGGSLELAWESPTPQDITPAAISAGDFDGNGIPELFVAGTRFHSPVTVTMEWFGSALAPKGDRIYGFLRAVPHPGEGVLLLGMAPGVDRALFVPGIDRYGWTGSGYEQQGAYPVTEQAIGVNVDFLQFEPDSEVLTVISTQGDDLVGLDAGGRAVFETEDVKGTMTRLFGEEGSSGSLDQDMVQISGRTVGHRTPAGENLVLLYKNGGGFGGLFKRSASFSRGKLIAYRWDGAGLSQVAESSDYGGYIADIGVTAGTATGPSLVAAVVRTNTGLLKPPLTRLVAYDLP